MKDLNKTPLPARSRPASNPLSEGGGDDDGDADEDCADNDAHRAVLILREGVVHRKGRDPLENLIADHEEQDARQPVDDGEEEA